MILRMRMRERERERGEEEIDSEACIYKDINLKI